MSPRILITGATGFIGTALAHRLNAEGFALRGAVRRQAPKDAPYGIVPVGDLHGGTHWQAAVQGVDVIVHLAARVPGSNGPETGSLSAFRRVNVEATATLARQAARAGVRRFIHVSTIKVHGESTPPGRPLREEDPRSPADAYARSKAEAETTLQAIARETGLETVILRPPLVYGPGMGGNLARLMGWVQRGVPLPLGAVTGNRRSLVGVDNLVDLIHRCVQHPAAAHQTFLVDDGVALSTAELLHAMGRAAGRPARLLPVPVPMLRATASLLGREGMARRVLDSLQVDSSKVGRVLHWRPPVSLEQGLARAVAPSVP
ncbi:NAD-dependent epimerase/dehydratase family protein [Ectothiorhodospira mobilis]|uniref:NAD-dependent epimerase/dehydratase family protein n=1 Tax=Ectothiorhodospira mobilis TaxID=195064 RepID=UPI001904E530|nr:NAD-dependent epimerase/dehydratase family protein [Ectothiorhodospira mobilis]MBK1692006.1 nucleoside-diphosphate sugar epimerase [Ectothiorhodospira mobilis]